ncbi:unnamed protein product [Fusarium graminearum]|nr:unnamed protein product [Fusarium graminearum]
MFRLTHHQILSSLKPASIRVRLYSSKASLNSNQGDPQLDFRSFVEVLRKDGDLADIDQEVDPNLEVGAVVRRVSETNAKAPLFHNVKGTRNGLWKMFGNAASLRNDSKFRYGRIARSLGLPPDSNWKDILEKMRLATTRDPLPPNILSTGQCKQNKIFGDDIDLTNLPLKLGKDEVPWALSLGAPPAATIAASIPIPPGVLERDYVSLLAGKPLDMVKCELSDLLVPANSEIILEGTFSLKDKALEGPFEDYIGMHFEGEAGNQPLFTVDAITYRDGAILPVSVPGRLTDESHTTASMASVQLLEALQQHDLPIKDAVAPLETLATWCILQVDSKKLAEMKTNPDELCTTIGNIAFNSKATMLINRILLIGDDVDIHDWADVIWAYTSRCRPGIDEYVFDEVMGLPLTPYRKYGRGSSVKGGKMICGFSIFVSARASEED